MSKTLLELTERQCRWPLGQRTEKATRFCGKRSAEGRPYCKDHCKRAYTRINTDKVMVSDGSRYSPKFVFVEAA